MKPTLIAGVPSAVSLAQPLESGSALDPNRARKRFGAAGSSGTHAAAALFSPLWQNTDA
jgi:hypothetical protein